MPLAELTPEQARQWLSVMRANLLSVCAVLQDNEDYFTDHVTTTLTHVNEFKQMTAKAWDLYNWSDEILSNK